MLWNVFFCTLLIFAAILYEVKFETTMSEFSGNTTEMKTMTILNRQLDYTQWTMKANERNEEKKTLQNI